MASTTPKYVPTPWNTHVQIHLLMALFHEAIGNGSYYKNTCEIVDEAKFISSGTFDLLCTYGWTKETIVAVAHTMCCALTVGDEAGRRRATVIVGTKAYHELHECVTEGECPGAYEHKTPSVLDLCHLIAAHNAYIDERPGKTVITDIGNKFEAPAEEKNGKQSVLKHEDLVETGGCAGIQVLDGEDDVLAHKG